MEDATAPSGSQTVEACVCGSGYFESDTTVHLDMSTCQPCPADHYCDNDNKAQCPENSYAPAMSTNIEHCICVAGFREVPETGNPVL
jgi:hypothetical protein